MEKVGGVGEDDDHRGGEGDGDGGVEELEAMMSKMLAVRSTCLILFLRCFPWFPLPLCFPIQQVPLSPPSTTTSFTASPRVQ